jgi:hypothetical protein
LESGHGDPFGFLKIEAVFHDLAHDERFVTAYLRILEHLRKSGLEKTVQDTDLFIH